MCLAPTRIPGQGFVACRECWQCRERKVDDWVGRNIAENKTAQAACVVSLTYGRDKSTKSPDHLRAAVLTYSDVQKMLKHLRVDGYPVRYFVTGEYGSTKGRAHWHIILYWQGAVPEYELQTEMYSWKYWPHGFAYFDKMGPAAVRYACKYLLKDSTDEAAQMFGPMPSKKPPLGDAFFRELAHKHVDAGLSPQNLFYSFPDVRRVLMGTRGKTAKQFHEQAKPIQFHMTGKTAENFCRYFVERWEEVHPDRPWPKSQAVMDVLYPTTAPPPWRDKSPPEAETLQWGRDPDGWSWSRKPRGFKFYYEIDLKQMKRIIHGKEKPDRPPVDLPKYWDAQSAHQDEGGNIKRKRASMAVYDPSRLWFPKKRDGFK